MPRRSGASPYPRRPHRFHPRRSPRHRPTFPRSIVRARRSARVGRGRRPEHRLYPRVRTTRRPRAPEPRTPPRRAARATPLCPGARRRRRRGGISIRARVPWPPRRQPRRRHSDPPRLTRTRMQRPVPRTVRRPSPHPRPSLPRDPPPRRRGIDGTRRRVMRRRRQTYLRSTRRARGQSRARRVRSTSPPRRLRARVWH